MALCRGDRFSNVIHVIQNFMFQIKNTISAQDLVVIGASFVLLAVMILPVFANAASYAYVDATGEVKSVTADTWMNAITIAPNIHPHSGVLLLSDAGDFTIVGDNVPAF